MNEEVFEPTCSAEIHYMTDVFQKNGGVFDEED